MSVELAPNGGLTIRPAGRAPSWESVVTGSLSVAVKLAEIGTGSDSLRASLEIANQLWELCLKLSDLEPVLEIELRTSADASVAKDVAYPFAFCAPGPEWRAVLPQESGVLLRISDAAYPEVLRNYYAYAYQGISMPWYGLTDGRSGLMVTLETPDDSGVRLDLQQSGTDSVFTAGPLWRPSMGKFRYPRRLSIRFIPDGGYVAMAKIFRQSLIDRGDFVTLREKARSRPWLAKLIGAMDVYLEGSGSDQTEIVAGLEKLGVRRMLVNTDAGESTISWLRDRGYLVGSYRTYVSIQPPGGGDGRSEPDIAHTHGYPDDAYDRPDGSPIRGFGYSESHPTTYRSSILQLPLMEQLIPPLRAIGYDAIFLDVVTASPLTEDYSPLHTLDRTADKMARKAVLSYANALGFVTGSEDGNSWAAPEVDYLEGMTMPKRYDEMKSYTINNYPVKFEPSDTYRHFNLNEQVRVPLWDLVFHDSVVSTWRWNLTPNRYLSQIWWDKQDLIYILQGDMPIFVIDKAIMAESGERIARTFKEVCEWNEKVGWDEMVDHRALNADRTVQESRFSSGWSVIVNFSDKDPYRLADGYELAPFSFAIRKGQGHWKPAHLVRNW